MTKHVENEREIRDLRASRSSMQECFSEERARRIEAEARLKTMEKEIRQLTAALARARGRLRPP